MFAASMRLLLFKPPLCWLVICWASAIKGEGNGTACGILLHRRPLAM
jgi:hypothetical protein